jgi:hypothetical protein
MANALETETFASKRPAALSEQRIVQDTRRELVAHAQRGGELRHSTDAERTAFTRRCGEMFQMLAATAEFQFC